MLHIYKISLVAASLGCALVMGGCGSDSLNHNSADDSYSSDRASTTGAVDLRSFKIEYQDADHIIFSWDPVEGADGYEVQLGRDMMSVNYTLPYEVSQPKINVGNKVGEGTWWIKVRAYGSNQSALDTFTITDHSAYIEE